MTTGQTVVNLYGQQGRRDKPELHHLKSALTKFLRKQKPKEVTLCKLGCELLSHSGDHLDWATQVRPVLEELGSRYKCKLIVWEQDPGIKKRSKTVRVPTFAAASDDRSSTSGDNDRNEVGISVPTGRKTTRNEAQTYSDGAAISAPAAAKPAAKKKAAAAAAARPASAPAAAMESDRTRDSRSSGLQAALAEGMADQIRTRLASAMPATARDTGAADSANLLEQLAVKAIRTEVANVLAYPSSSRRTAPELQQALSRGFGKRPSHGRTRIGGLDNSSDSAASFEDEYVRPPTDGEYDSFDNRVRGLVMALLQDPSRDLMEPMPYGDYAVTSDPFPTAGEGPPTLLSSGAAGAWSLTRPSGQIVVDDEAFERKERAKLERAARAKEKQAKKIALWKKAQKFFANRLPKTTANVFIAWADKVQGTKRLQKLADSLVDKREKKQRQAAFALMRSGMAERKTWRNKIAKFAAKMMGNSVRGCFQIWVNVVAETKRAAAVKAAKEAASKA